ncbi:hypothetical protein ES703_75130 [subsurface metagenome]
MTQEVYGRPWQAEARTAETKQFIRDIKHITRRKFTAEEKIRIVLEGFRRDAHIKDLCRREGIRPSYLYYTNWLIVEHKSRSSPLWYGRLFETDSRLVLEK